MASDVRREVAKMRAQADFLAKHEEILEELHYSRQMEILQAERDLEIERFAETHPRLGEARVGEKVTMEEVTYVDYSCGWHQTFNVHGPHATEMMTRLRRAFGGMFIKAASSWDFSLTQDRSFEDGGTIRITTGRDEVCTKKVIGTEVKVIPAVEAQPERTEIIEKVEWECPSILEDAARPRPHPPGRRDPARSMSSSVYVLADDEQDARAKVEKATGLRVVEVMRP